MLLRALALVLALTLGCAGSAALYRDSDRELLTASVAFGDSHVIYCREDPMLDPNTPQATSLRCEGESVVGGNVSAEAASLLSTLGSVVWSGIKLLLPLI